MKKKTGVVVKADNHCVSVRTVKGEFYDLELKGEAPKIGDIYTGPILASNFISKNLIIILSAILIIGICIYNYFINTSHVIVSIPPTIQLKVNKWDKIIDAKSSSQSGRNLLKTISLKNKSIDNGLKIIFNEAQKQKYIDEDYTENRKAITIYVPDANNKDLDLTSFVKYAKERKVNCLLNYNGTDPTL